MSSELPTEAPQHHVQLDQFEGPLDLLLYLIRKSEINIYDIPIHEITEQYLGLLEYSAKIDLESITEFYGLAATLLYIKSRMLLPTQLTDDDDFDDPRQELVDQLIEYQKFKKLTDLMTDQESASEWVIEPRRKQRSFDFVDDEELWQEIEVWDLFQTFSSIMSNLSSERIIDLFEEVSINEKLTLINELLEERGEFLFADIVIRSESLMDLVCAFLAILEAAKTHRISILQNRLFGDIRIRSRDAEPATGVAQEGDSDGP